MPVRHDRMRRVGGAAALAVVAAVGFVLWIPMQRPDASRLAHLVITSPLAGLHGPPKRSAAPATSSPLEAVRGAAASTPGETGVYSVAWQGAGPVSTASVSATVLPSRTSAHAARGDATRAYLRRSSFTGSGYGFGGTLEVRSVPGAAGAYFLRGTSPVTTASTPRAAVVIYDVGRVVVDVTAYGEGAATATAARALAVAEYRHLLQVGGDPQIARTVLPLVASIVYVVVALAVIGCSPLVPAAFAWIRHRRALADEAALRRERVARGKKLVRRRARRAHGSSVAGAGARRRR